MLYAYRVHMVYTIENKDRSRGSDSIQEPHTPLNDKSQAIVVKLFESLQELILTWLWLPDILWNLGNTQHLNNLAAC